MKKTRRRGSIMVALRALDRSSGRLLRKAAVLAKTHACGVDLVHIVSIPYVPAFDGGSTRQAARDITKTCKRSLEKLAASPILRGIKTTTRVAWDYPVADGLVRLVLKHRPQLVLAESQRHARLARPFLANTDWELIRKCPCPLWLSKGKSSKFTGRVIAALDPMHANAKPAALDTIILRQALEVAGGRPAKVRAFHAYLLPTPPIIAGAVEAYWIGMSEAEIKSYESKVRRELDRLADAHEIPPKNRLLVFGDPATALPRIAKRQGASVVVMGAVSRSALRRVFIGHTAERVIDALACDVLVVKPRDFKTSVAPRRRPVFDLPTR